MTFNRVNPPTHIRIPEEVSSNPQLRKLFEDILFNMFQEWKRTGGGTDFIDQNETNITESFTLSKLFDIREQIGSNKPVTIDTTGFTIDTTEQTIDMTEV